MASRLPLVASSRWRLLLKAAVSIALLSWLFARVDWQDFSQALAKMHPGFATLSFVFILFSQCCGAFRLWLLLRDRDIGIPLGYALRLTFLGRFFSNFLPGTVGGDVVKIIALGRAGHSRAVSTTCVVADRLLNMGAVFLLLPSVLSIAPAFDLSREHILVPVVIALPVAFIIGLVASPFLLRLLLAYAFRHPSDDPSFLARLGRTLHDVHAAARAWVHRPTRFLEFVGISLALVGSSIVATWTLGSALGMSVTLPQFAGVVVLVYFATLVPISLNGLGITETSTVYLLSKLGATTEAALALAIVNRIFYLALSVPGGFSLLSTDPNPRPPDATAPARHRKSRNR